MPDAFTGNTPLSRGNLALAPLAHPAPLAALPPVNRWGAMALCPHPESSSGVLGIGLLVGGSVVARPHAVGTSEVVDHRLHQGGRLTASGHAVREPDPPNRRGQPEALRLRQSTTVPTQPPGRFSSTLQPRVLAAYASTVAMSKGDQARRSSSSSLTDPHRARRSSAGSAICTSRPGETVISSPGLASAAGQRPRCPSGRASPLRSSQQIPCARNHHRVLAPHRRCHQAATSAGLEGATLFKPGIAAPFLPTAPGVLSSEGQDRPVGGASKRIVTWRRS